MLSGWRGHKEDISVYPMGTMPAGAEIQAAHAAMMLRPLNVKQSELKTLAPREGQRSIEALVQGKLRILWHAGNNDRI